MTTKISRTMAADIIDYVRTRLAEGADAATITRCLDRQFDIAPLTACSGEAHGNHNIDNCGVCAPRWGFVGDKVVVR